MITKCNKRQNTQNKWHTQPRDNHQITDNSLNVQNQTENYTYNRWNCGRLYSNIHDRHVVNRTLVAYDVEYEHVQDIEVPAHSVHLPGMDRTFWRNSNWLQGNDDNRLRITHSMILYKFFCFNFEIVYLNLVSAQNDSCTVKHHSLAYD